MQIHPRAVVEEAVRGNPPLPKGPELAASLRCKGLPFLHSQIKQAGWAPRPSKLMSCIGFMSSVVAAHAQFLRMQLINASRLSSLTHSVKLSRIIVTQ